MKKLGKIICSVSMALLAGVMVAADVLSVKYFAFIDEGINGSGVNYSTASRVLAKGDAFVKEIMEEGITMLKNTSGTAPYAYNASDPDANRKTNVFGWSSVDAGFLISGYGSGISRIPENKRVLFYDGFDKYNEIYPKKKIEYNANLKSFYENWCKSRAITESLGGNDKLYTNYNPKVDVYTSDENKVNGKTLLEDAKEYSDNAIVVISRQSGEAQDCPQMYSYVVNEKNGSPTRVERSYLSLTDEEIDLIDMVKNNFSNVTILLNCTNMVECGAFSDDKIQNVYYIGVTGQSGARAIPSVLTGDVNPSGRITETCVTDHSENPSFYNFGRVSSASVTYVEDIYVGYKFFETADVEGYWDGYTSSDATKSNGKTGYDGIVEYPFGKGLSYTTFSYEFAVETKEGEEETTTEEAVIPASGSSITLDTKIKLTVKVTNIGAVKGKDVVEIYYTAPYTKGGIEKASINLLDFGKTKLLKPGESDYLTFELDPYYMASYDCYDKNSNGFKGYELEKGQYQIKLMKDAHTPLLEDNLGTITYKIDEDIKIDKDTVTGNEVKNRFTGDDAFDGTSLDRSDTSLYLSRSDFEGTIKKTTLDNYTKAGTVKATRTYTDLPTFNEDNGLYLYTDLDGNKITDANLLHSPTSDKVKANLELMKELGSDYNNEKWDLILNQLTYTDATNLIVMGGYSTIEAESVGKIWMRDNDGPMGLTRSNASVTETSQWTWFPMAGLIGNSFNKELAKNYGKTIANEANETGVNGWYAPGCNIRRSPFGGRNNEYYGEDAIHSGYMSAYTVQGALSGRLTTYVKHFALNECETNRGGIKTWTTEQALREIYLRAFELSVKVGKTNGIMSAFNSVGGTTARQNGALLTYVLRDEWGFEGTVVTDWMGGAGDAKQGIMSGNNLWLNGSQQNNHNLGSSWMEDVQMANDVRESCKSILYMVCNTQIQTEEVPVIVDVIRNKPLWIMSVVGINLALFDGILLLTYFAFIRKGKESDNTISQEDEEIKGE